jgi:hypothetical protein
MSKTNDKHLQATASTELPVLGGMSCRGFNSLPSHASENEPTVGKTVGNSLRVLVACEFSGRVRDAFAARGHDAWSCDLLPSETVGKHICGDVENVLNDGWDLLIAHPPCRYLAVSGARWFKDRIQEQSAALAFVGALLSAPIRYIALENPISVISTHIRKPNQIIQPWQFGHGEVKATCLWLKNLPPLVPTNIVEGRTPRVHYVSPGPDRWKERSRILPGIAEAMAKQWGAFCVLQAAAGAPLFSENQA